MTIPSRPGWLHQLSRRGPQFGRLRAYHGLDPDWALPTKPRNQLSGVEENMLRSYRILTGKTPP